MIFLLPKGALLFQPRKVGAISLQNSSFSSSSYYSSVFFPIFPVSRTVPKTFIAAALLLSGEVERVICLGKKVSFLSVL